jgi:hypothetical protein
MNMESVANLSFQTILERKLFFLLESETMPFDSSDSSDIGERDALQDMLKDIASLNETAFVEKYMGVVVKLNKRIESKEYSVEDKDDYYEAYNNKVVTVLTLINPENEFYPDNEDKYL